MGNCCTRDEDTRPRAEDSEDNEPEETKSCTELAKTNSTRRSSLTTTPRRGGGGGTKYNPDLFLDAAKRAALKRNGSYRGRPMRQPRKKNNIGLHVRPTPGATDEEDDENEDSGDPELYSPSASGRWTQDTDSFGSTDADAIIRPCAWPKLPLLQDATSPPLHQGVFGLPEMQAADPNSLSCSSARDTNRNGNGSGGSFFGLHPGGRSRSSRRNSLLGPPGPLLGFRRTSVVVSPEPSQHSSPRSWQNAGSFTIHNTPGGESDDPSQPQHRGFSPPLEPPPHRFHRASPQRQEHYRSPNLQYHHTQPQHAPAKRLSISPVFAAPTGPSMVPPTTAMLATPTQPSVPGVVSTSFE